MYELTVQTEFCAAHAIWIRGVREPIHGHNWRVSVVVAGDRLDEDGLLCDFHDVERALAETIAPWRDRSLNDASPFAPDGRGLNPTAEHVARQIALGVGTLIAGHMNGRGTVARVSITEAPGCIATYVAESVPHEQRGMDR
ncbi:MAG: 6-carboxytetrahydropterin synthase [Phycisphaeraceae bacterium]|nr:MAG: 6-carboxytetrahydropterin synthase [Phycisphaeraceae bacterium]